MAQTLPKVAGVELNNEIRAEINITPEAEEATYGDMTRAFSNIATAINENVYTASYLSDGGFGSSAVVGAAPQITLTGDFIKGDPVCEYLDGIQYEIGNKRVTDVKMTRNGKTLKCPVTLTGIAIAGGDSNTKSTENLSGSYEDLQSALNDVKTKYDLLNSAQDEFNNTGSLSVSTLQSIISTYPALQEKVEQYLAGLIDERELLEAMTEAYDTDQQNYYKYLLTKQGYRIKPNEHQNIRWCSSVLCHWR